MFSVKIQAGSFSCEISGSDFSKSREDSEKFIKEFSEMPGFEIPGEKTKPKKTTKSVENYTSKSEICNPEILAGWLSEQKGNHAKAWIVKECPYTNAGPVLTSMLRTGKVATAETAYIKSSGNTGFMEAYYLPGDTLPEPWPNSNPELDDQILMHWISVNEGFTPLFVENNCGIPPRYAKKALTRALLKNDVFVRKDNKDKGRVHKGQADG